MEDGLGARLREARSRRRLTLHEVEAAIKIRPRYLQAIENEAWDQLPGETYARAFIRTYGDYLGLDGEELAEEQRRSRGAMRPGERLPRVDPRPRRSGRGSGPAIPWLSPRALTTIVTALVVVALIAILLLSGSGGEGGPPSRQAGGAGAGKGAPPARQSPAKAVPPGHEIRLLATGEVWVCLLDGQQRPLLNGVILFPGEREGPFRSGSFMLALGNGAVTMTVDGKQQHLPEPSSPIGFSVDSSGAVRELPEGERPTCT